MQFKVGYIVDGIANVFSGFRDSLDEQTPEGIAEWGKTRLLTHFSSFLAHLEGLTLGILCNGRKN